jgi:hypothetical protein
MDPYDTIAFDDRSSAASESWRRIKRYCEEHPDKIVIATGDTPQLESINWYITN